jgi:hypothetical protein
MNLKKKLVALLIVVIISSVAVYEVFSIQTPPPPANTVGQGWLTDWSYRKGHEIQGSQGAGTDYQLKITVHYPSGADSASDVYLARNCQRNFGDVRFTNADGVTLLNYWVENQTDNSTAVFWVKVNDNLDSNQVIYLYYGNSAVSSASDIKSTFPFADDFSTNSLDTAKWQSYGSGRVKMDKGMCTLETVSSTGNSMYILGKTPFPANYAIRFSSSVIEQGDYRWSHHGFATIYNSSSSGARIDEYPNYITMSQEEMSYAWSLRARAYGSTTRVDVSKLAPAPNVFYTYEIQRNASTNVIFLSNGAVQGTISTNVPKESMGAMFGVDNGGTKLYSVTVIDWVVMHKFVYPEPLQGAWGTQESAPA